VPDVRGGGTARRVNADVTARQLLGAFGLESESTAVRMRASWANLERGLAGSIVQPSLTGRETSARAAAGADLRVVRHGVTWTGAADLTRERLTFVDPAPPFGVAYDDAVTARGATMNGGATTRIGPITAAVGGELRTIDVVSTMLAPGAPRRQRLVGAWASSRYTHAFDVDTRIDIDAGARIDESSLDGAAAVSPRATVGLTRGHLGASATIANGYSPPALADQFFHEGVLVRANPALRPERTTGDLEARVALRDIDAGPISISGHASAFRANVDGMIVWLPDFRFVWSPSNVAVDRRGFEASGRLSLFRDAVALQGTLNHTAVTYAGPVLSGQVAYRPAATASTSASARVAGGRVEVTHRFVSARRTVPGSALNALDPYWLTDARWTMPVRLGRWQTDVGVGLENAFDRPAAMLVDYPFPGRTWSVSLRMRHSPLS
jgi:iron complex outermembrane receptor protein